MTFRDLLLQVRQKIIHGYKNQNYPMDTLLYELDIPLSADDYPLFDIAVLLENVHDKRYIQHTDPGMYFSFSSRGDSIEVSLEYRSSLYTGSTAERIISHYTYFLEAALADVNLQLSQIDIMSRDEREQLLYTFSSPGEENSAGIAARTRDKTIQELFEEQVEKVPGNIAAAVYGSGSTSPGRPGIRKHEVTYRELNETSNRLAWLLKEKGVRPDTIVGLMLEPSIDMIAGILATLKAGGAYLPIDIDTPPERVYTLLQDSAAAFLITEGKRRRPGKINADKEMIDLSDETVYGTRGKVSGLSNPPKINTSIDLAYVIYTSGSTGTPKGVLIEHRSILNYVFWRLKGYNQTWKDVSMQLLSISFDGFCANLYPAILNGGKVILLSEDKLKDIDYILGVIKEEKITTFSLTPLLYKAIVETAEEEDLQSVKFVVIGGERANKHLLEMSNKAAPHLTLINEYGPTENSVTTTANRGMTQNNLSIVGRPIANNNVFILDGRRELKPPGVPGELCVSGKGLARGYLNNPGLTAEKFIKNPFVSSASLMTRRMYRTGDLGRWLPQGDIELVGRLDEQLKIRGYRVEMGEIETRLSGYPGIKEAAVITDGGETDDGKDIQLYAFYVAVGEDSALDAGEIRQYMLSHLPDYFVPSYFFSLGTIPRLSTGKIDRKSLLKLAERTKVETAFVEPRNETEKKVAVIWKNMLDLEKVSVTANFFNIGGDSIKVLSLLNSINKEFETNFKVLDLYENETIAKIAVRISDDETPGIPEEYKKALEEIEKLKERVIKDSRLPKDIEVEDIYPMSDIEKGMVFYSIKDSLTSIYHNQMVYQVKDKNFSLEIFKEALGLMVDKHPILRTGFDMFDFEEPIQIVHKNITLPMNYEDLSSLDRVRQEKHITSILGKDRESHFNVTTAEPLWRIKIFTLDSENVCIVWICHHAVTDGWSNASLMTELNNTYLELKKDANFVPRKLKNSYKEFVIEQMAWKEKPGIIEYWKKELAGYKRFEFPGGIKDKQGASGVKNNKGRELGVELLEKLNGLALKYNTSVKYLCFAAYVYMLNMVSYENDIVVGLITNIRPSCEDGDKIIGCFLNTVPVRVLIPSNIRWKDFIRLVSKKLVELKKYDRLTLYEIVKIIGEQQAQGKNPVSDTIFNYTDFFVYDDLNPEIVNGDIPGADDSRLHVESLGETNTLFDFLVDVTGGMPGFAVNYSPQAIDEEKVDTLCDCFKRILIKFVEEPEGLMEKDKVLSHEEKQTILYEWNRTGAGYPRAQTIHGLFREQAARTPDGAAVVGSRQLAVGKREKAGERGEKVQLTYRELNQKSGRLARLLREKGVQPDTIVGIMLERSVEMIAGILGILKAGGAYLPIDPAYPQERIDFMLKDSNASVLVSEESEVLDLSLPTAHCPLPPASPASPSNLAYVIYTSGTTGKPKGVLIQHKNVVRLLFNDKFQFDFNRRDIWTMFHSYCFDFSVWEMYGALLYGGKLIVVPKMIARDPARYLRVLKDNGVTVLNQTPSAFYNLIDEEMTHEDKTLRLRYVIFGGEALTPARLRDWVKKYPRTRLVNMFGITETTVHVTYKEITHREIRLNTGNIGTPIPTLSTYIVDRNLFPLPNGAAGELCVSGQGVGRGYLNRPQSTAEKFLACPFKTGERLYRSGDLSRRLPSGDMEYLGRIDHQVQLRGFRTEPGEIENTLLGHGGIKEAAVVATETPDGDKELAAYLVVHDQLNLEALRRYLAGKLPDYMIPSHFTRLERLPLTANGKVDRKALTSQKGVDLKRGTQYVAPGNEIEETLVRVWQEVLDKEKIGVHDDYFSLGGDSIKAIRLIGRINNICKTSLQVKDIYLYPQISSMAAYIPLVGNTDTLQLAEERIRAEEEIENLKSSIMNNTGLSDGLPAGWEDFYPASDIEKLMITYNSRYSQGGMYHDQFAYQVEDDSFNFELFKKAFSLLVEKHSTLRTGYNFSDYEIPLHIVHSTLDLTGKVQYEDISPLPTPRQKTYLEDFLKTDRRHPFDITIPGLWRMRVFRLTEKEYCILWIFHHAILDGWSNASLWTELSNIYYSLKNNGTYESEPLRVTYKDYIVDQQRIINSPAIKEYWRKKLAGCKRTPLPLGKSVDMARWNGEAELYTFLLDSELCRALKELSEQANTSVKAICLSAFVYLITAAANSGDITIGLVTNGRPDIEDGEKVSGCFLNMIPFRLQIPGGITARDLLETVTAASRELKSYDKLSLLEITRLLGEEISEGNPIFDIMLNFVEFHIYEEAHETARTQQPIVAPYEGMNTFFDFLIARQGEQMHYTIRFPVKLYNEKEIEMISDYYKKILTHLVNEYEMEMPGVEKTGLLR